MTHRDYYKNYLRSVQEYGEILIVLAFGGEKTAHGNKGFDIYGARVNGQTARIEVKSKLAHTSGGKATVVHCNDNKFAKGGMTHLAVVLVEDATGDVTESWLLTRAAAKGLRRKKTKSRYINVNDVREFPDKQVITKKLNSFAGRQA